MTSARSTTMPGDDADLVQASRAGDRDAFGHIVARYQTLVCALAYSATGNLSRSEDLAQETFLAAWQRLPALREPPKLRAWLCGIARNLISNAQRRASRDPAHVAEPFDATHEVTGAEASPPEQAVSREEEALLWHALERIPDTYREPLVLFYREHKSVEAVARELELSEDAVKQRLSRGRALLQEQVLAFVEGTLARTNPGRAFTGGVMAALPVASAGIAATAGAATSKSVAGAKGAPWLVPLATVFSAQVLWFVSSVAFVAGVGGFVGWQMSSPVQSAKEHRWAGWFWRLLVGGLAGCVVLPLLVLKDVWTRHPQYLGWLTFWVGLFYLGAGASFVGWMLENHHRVRGERGKAGAIPAGDRKRLNAWVGVATLAMVILFVSNLVGSPWQEKVGPDEVARLIAAPSDARIRIIELKTGNRWADIVVAGQAKTRRYGGAIDEATFLRLKQSGRRFETQVEGRDYNVVGWPAERFGLVMILVIGAGSVMLARDALRSRSEALAVP